MNDLEINIYKNWKNKREINKEDFYKCTIKYIKDTNFYSRIKYCIQHIFREENIYFSYYNNINLKFVESSYVCLLTEEERNNIKNLLNKKIGYNVTIFDSNSIGISLNKVPLSKFFVYEI